MTMPPTTGAPKAQAPGSPLSSEAAVPPPFGDAAIDREEVHFRRIDMRGYRRNDGLYEVEGRVTDRKADDFTPASDGYYVAAGEAVHDMGVRLVFDERLVVHEVQSFTRAAPYRQCPEAGPSLQAIKGLRMTSGWGREVRTRLGGAQSCTHLMELLMPLATVAYQTLGGTPPGRPEPVDANGRPVKIDSCYAYAAERELVHQRWPAYARPAAPKD
jgi:hypothetical protein